MAPRAVLCLGAADRAIGLLESVRGELSGAADLLSHAIETNERLGARPYLALSHVDRAGVLVRRAGPGDPEAARSHAAEALGLADALGMPDVAARARALSGA